MAGEAVNIESAVINRYVIINVACVCATLGVIAAFTGPLSSLEILLFCAAWVTARVIASFVVYNRL